MTAETRAVVIGGGLAGMLASAVLARHVDRVTVVERDVFPDGPELRKGVPQARHAHLLWSGGARAIESLLPGTLKELADAGAHRLYLPRDIVWFTPYGWQTRFPGSQFMITASRALLDWVVREQALKNPRIEVLQETGVTGLLGTAARVTGVRLRDAAGQESELAADFVVDTGGRPSQTLKWLPELGLPEVEEDVVDTGIAYATRVYRAPAGAETFPMVNVAAAPAPASPAATAPSSPSRAAAGWSPSRAPAAPSRPPRTRRSSPSRAACATRSSPTCWNAPNPSARSRDPAPPSTAAATTSASPPGPRACWCSATPSPPSTPSTGTA